MINIALVDDDLEHIKLLRTYIQDFGKQENFVFDVQEYHNGLNFVEDYDGTLDIVFMDIEMPHLDGMEAARRIREKDSRLAIIFITNMAQYAIHGYEVNAVDFIVKPIGYYVFADKLKKAIRLTERKVEKEFLVFTDDEVVKLNSSQIVYLEKDKNYLIYHTMQGNYRMRGTMSEIEKGLEQEGFSKCINGCLVNLSYVTKMDKENVWLDQILLPISRQRRKSFKEDFMKYVGGQC